MASVQVAGGRLRGMLLVSGKSAVRIRSPAPRQNQRRPFLICGNPQLCGIVIMSLRARLWLLVATGDQSMLHVGCTGECEHAMGGNSSVSLRQRAR
jgi:hypothetical protein